MKVAYIFILLSFVFVQCVQEQDDSKNNESKEPTSEKKVDKDDAVDKTGTQKFVSTALGVEEYLEIRTDERGYETWFYSSEKNLKQIEMGVLSRNAVQHIYFKGKPDEKYYIDFENCGFILTDSNNEEQWYRQTEPKCGI